MAGAAADRHKLPVSQQTEGVSRTNVLAVAVLEDTAVFGPLASREQHRPSWHAQTLTRIPGGDDRLVDTDCVVGDLSGGRALGDE